MPINLEISPSPHAAAVNPQGPTPRTRRPGRRRDPKPRRSRFGRGPGGRARKANPPHPSPRSGGGRKLAAEAR
jgi:hypothetical protein